MNEPDPYEEENHRGSTNLQVKDISVDVKIYETEKTEGAEEYPASSEFNLDAHHMSNKLKDLDGKGVAAGYLDGVTTKPKTKQKFSQPSGSMAANTNLEGSEHPNKAEQSSLFMFPSAQEDKPRYALLLASMFFKEPIVFSKIILLIKLLDLLLIMSVSYQISSTVIAVSLINFCTSLGLYGVLRKQLSLDRRLMLFQIILLSSFSLCLIAACYQVLTRMVEVDLAPLKIPCLLLSLIQTMIWLGQSTLIYYFSGRQSNKEGNKPITSESHRPEDVSIDNQSSIMGKSHIPVEVMIPISKAGQAASSGAQNGESVSPPKLRDDSQQQSKNQNIVSNETPEHTDRQPKKIKRRQKGGEKAGEAGQEDLGQSNAWSSQQGGGEQQAPAEPEPS